jgi:hypothetical protein
MRPGSPASTSPVWGRWASITSTARSSATRCSIRRGPRRSSYEPRKYSGGFRLVALESIVFKDAWDATHSSPPSLFGQEFMVTPSPNRFGIPAFYALHAWLFRGNRLG